MFNPISFIAVFAMLTGNASVGQIDLFLTVMLPVMVFILIIGPTPKVRANRMIGGVLIFVFLIIVGLRVSYLDMSYTTIYGYWPYKAGLLGMVLLIAPRLDWPPLNHLLLGLFCLFLLAMGEFRDGRFESVFGPNMLYRIFGCYLLLSVALVIFYRQRITSMRYMQMMFGGAAVLATGSSGGIVLIIASLGVFALRLRAFVRLTWPLLIAATVLLAYSGMTILNSAAASRTFYKVETFELSIRFIGLSELLGRPVDFLGNAYSDYADLWLFGYAYPHNLFVELYVFYGFLSIPLMALLALTLLGGRRKLGAVYFAFFAVFVGAQFSGDVSENWGLFGATFALLRVSASDEAKDIRRN